MGEQTAIEWTDATWNPVTGCTKVSAGCDNCYAAAFARRRLKHTYLLRRPAVETDENEADPFAVRLWPERLAQPERWSRPRMIFVNSMSDLFHKDIPVDYVRRIFEVMLACDRHIYQVLTKRPARAASFWASHAEELGHAEIPAHIWLGTSIENQRVAYRRSHLVRVPAAVRFLSCEPLLGPLNLDLEGIHWVIVGGESGSNHRSMESDWSREIREQCQRNFVPFFFKQWGGRTPKAGGRLLDGREWNEFPAVVAAGTLAGAVT
ncbi:MAG: phage Gp37/Gp68 family protein [Gemmatimonadales bacterium]|nr:phage Gp37/Gp68 family protein [Gemmatimonadales bacterium]MYG20162.1 phage Gp37/Gp68 family protein [Gemmatimonadales bacterium]MYH10434.1 phage Gp37/Gp68 family protein [Gemmatimonadales bacterium]